MASPAVLSSPDHYWAQVGSQAWGFFHGDIPLALMPGKKLNDRLKAAFEEVALCDVDDRLNEIQVSTLVTGGRHDPIVPAEESIGIHKNIPNSSLLVLENSKHGAEGEDVAIFEDAVRRFFSKLAP